MYHLLWTSKDHDAYSNCVCVFRRTSKKKNLKCCLWPDYMQTKGLFVAVSKSHSLCVWYHHQLAILFSFLDFPSCFLNKTFSILFVIHIYIYTSECYWPALPHAYFVVRLIIFPIGVISLEKQTSPFERNVFDQLAPSCTQIFSKWYSK